MKTFMLWAGFTWLSFNTFGQGSAFQYQGRLNAGANPVTGTYDLRFAIYDAPNAGTQQGNLLTNSAMAISNGLFTVTLDFGNQFPGAERWLEIGVRTNGGGAFSTLAPRQQITPTPYAVTAVNAAILLGNLPASQLSGTVPPAQLPAGVVTNGASGVNLAGTFSGTFGNFTNLELASASNAPVNRLRFNDAVPNQQIYWHAAKNMDLETVNDGTSWVGHDFTGVVDHDATAHIKHDSNLTVDNDRTQIVHGNDTETVDKNKFQTVNGSVSQSVLSNVNCTIGLGLTTTVGGNLLLQTGGNLTATAGSVLGLASAGDAGLTSGHDLTLHSVHNSTLLAENSLALTVGTAMAATIGGSMSLTVGNSLGTSAGLDTSLQAGRNISLIPGTGVGVGTASPQGSLHVYSANNPTVMRIQSTGTPGFGRLEFVSNPQGDVNEWRPGFMQSLDAGGFTGGIGFYVNGTGAGNKFATNEVMRIQNGRVGIGTTAPGTLLQVGAATCNGATWANGSDRNSKENFQPVDARDILERVAALPLSRWNYKSEATQQHLGPMAQDFHAAFGLNGPDDKHISTVDADGVALAAIQGLNQKLERENAELRHELAEIKRLLQSR